MILGVTGSRHEPTQQQKTLLAMIFADLQVDRLHHGACIGVDAYTHQLAVDMGIPITVHPPVDNKLVAAECLIAATDVDVLTPRPYLHRDRDICAASEGMLAVPASRDETSGGTWYTAHYMLRLGKPVQILYANGSVEQRFPPEIKGM